MTTTQDALVDATILLGYLNTFGALAVVGCVIGWAALRIPAVRRFIERISQ